MIILKNEILSKYTSFKIGGPAKYFVILENVQDLEILNKFNDLPVFILGGGTNVLIDYFSGLVLKPAIRYLKLPLIFKNKFKDKNFSYRFPILFDKNLNDNEVIAGSGLLVSELLNIVSELGLQGLEWAGGLPGTIGGAIEGGVGCFGGEFKNQVVEVLAFNFKTKQLKIFTKEECQFSYRSSFFRQTKQWIILEAKLIFHPGWPTDFLLSQIEEKIKYRQQKHPLEFPNAGSVFKNIPFDQAPLFVQELSLKKNKVKNDPFKVIPIAFLIDYLGLTGKRQGDAQISPKHANFIVNLGKATFNDVYNLICLVKKTFEDQLNLSPEVEIQIIKKDGIIKL